MTADVTGHEVETVIAVVFVVLLIVCVFVIVGTWVAEVFAQGRERE